MDIIVCLLVLSRLCCTIGIVDFQWSVKFSWRMGVLEEQDGAVVGVLAQLPVH